MNRSFLMLLAATTCGLSISVPASADPVQQDLDAKATVATGVFAGLQGQTVQVRIIYDDDMMEEFPFPVSGEGDSYKTDFPASNGVFDVGFEIEINGIVRSTVGKGDDGVHQHDIRVNDEPAGDRFKIFVQNFFDPVNQGEIELEGDSGYILPGDGGLKGVPLFPPDYCATGNFGGEVAKGRMVTFAGGVFEGQLNFDILEGPTCSGASADMCGDANGDGMVSATDALIGLGAAVGTGMCMLCRCDVDDSGMTSATDALAILQASVGQPVALNCPAC